MADVPLPPAETVDDAMRRASQGIDALKRAKPATPAEARRRAAELMRHQQDLIDAAQRVTNAAATKQFAKPNGAGTARAAANVGMDAEALDRAIWPYMKIIADNVMPYIKELEQRIAVLEARPQMKYCGVWDWEKVYSVGDFVTDEGSLWHCQDTCKDVRPGSSDGAWKLAVKRGRDGKGIR